MSSSSSRGAAEVLSDLKTGSFQSSTSLFSPNTISPGQIRNSVKDDTDKYAKLCQDTSLCIRKVVYCQSGISNNLTRSHASTTSNSTSVNPNRSRGGGINPKSIINHEFLLIVIKVGDGEHYYLAEKCGAGEECGIIVREVNEAEMEMFEEAGVTTFDCEDTHMTMTKLMEIVEDHDPDYTAHEKNCWLYAVETTKKLLIACQEETGKQHFGDMSKLVGIKVTVNHVKDMAARGLQVLFDLLASKSAQ